MTLNVFMRDFKVKVDMCKVTVSPIGASKTTVWLACTLEGKDYADISNLLDRDKKALLKKIQ